MKESIITKEDDDYCKRQAQFEDLLTHARRKQILQMLGKKKIDRSEKLIIVAMMFLLPAIALLLWWFLSSL